jgi:hypothetical protein
MKRWLALSTLALACANAYATPVYHPLGPNLTYGAVTNNQTIISNITNPAGGAAVFTKEESQYRFGILSNLGFGYEFGDVENLYNEIDDAQVTLESDQNLSGTDVASLCPGLTPAPASVSSCADAIAADLNTRVFTSVNNVLNTAQEDGYARGFGSLHVPVLPLVISNKSLGGSFVLDANYSATANMTFLADPVALQGSDILAAIQSYASGGGTGTLSVPVPTDVSDTTLLVRGGAVFELGFGFSRTMLEVPAGQLAAGVRAKYYKVGLSRVATRLIGSEGSEDTFNADEDYEESAGFGIDLGALWISKHYRAGAWVDNINQPSFDYNEIDTAAAGYTDAAIIAQLQDSESYEMSRQVHLEGAVFTESQNWVIAVGLDVNAVEDATGNEYKWATISAGYATDSWWIPGFRVGYRANMAGTELSYLTGGLTLFKTVNMDLAYGLDSVEIDGESAPRSFMFNLGFELTF